MQASTHPAISIDEAPSYWSIVWGQFQKRRLAYGSMWAGVALYVLAIMAPLLASNKPFLWRVDQGPWESPWWGSLFDRNFFESELDIFFNALLVPGLLVVPAAWLWWRHTRNRKLRLRSRSRRNFLLCAAALWTLTFVVISNVAGSKSKVLHPALAAELQRDGHTVTAIYPPFRYSFRDVDLTQIRADVSREHWLGTDDAGRDVMVRLLYGTRISLTVGIFAVLLYIVMGTVIGAVAGYFGGRIDAAFMRLIEVVISIPSLFLILTVAAFVEQRSIFHIMLIIAAVNWTTPARLVRAEFLRLRNLDFVAAARAVGYSESQIIFKQMLPNALGPVLVTATFGVASSILVESTMSFLGLGDITVPSWGQVLNTGRTTGIWTMILAPGFAIFVTVSLLNLIGDGLRDALDPKMRT
jgi:peptide/nickel transport system permease protein